jgi:hypothetical protein
MVMVRQAANPVAPDLEVVADEALDAAADALVASKGKRLKDRLLGAAKAVAGVVVPVVVMFVGALVGLPPEITVPLAAVLTGGAVYRVPNKA